MTSHKTSLFQSSQVLVFGDLMLDKYWHGDTQRISPEAPVPVVKIQREEDRPGGAANVAMNIQALGAKASCIGCIGEDDKGEKLISLLTQAGVQIRPVYSSGPTITKLRVISRQQQLIRMDFEESMVDTSPWQALQDQLNQQLKQHKVLILSDYAKGTILDPQPLIQAALTAKRLVMIDPKGADFARYKGASLITPNLSEFEAVVGPIHSEASLEAKALELIEAYDFQSILVTRGAEGMSLIQKAAPALHIPAHAKEVFDVTGAGDTVIATIAAALGAGIDLEQAVEMANYAASIAVRKLGTALVTWEALEDAMDDSTTPFGSLQLPELLKARKKAKIKNETIVMTNGCFDLLHAGHIQYLEEAKALGDRLIVAVNSDQSVKQLKGPERPIQSLENRMKLLASLKAVDWVIGFEGETPAELIEQLLPDILVKGGDYTIEAIAGHEAVLANGGSVKVLSFVPNQSTSQMINKIISADQKKPVVPH